MVEFNHSHLLSIKILTYVTLKSILDELISNARNLAQSLELVLGQDHGNK